MEYLYEQNPTHKYHTIILGKNDGELGPQFAYPEKFRINHLVYDETANTFYIIHTISYLTEKEIVKIEHEFNLFQEFLKMNKPIYNNNDQDRMISRRWTAFFDPEYGIVTGDKDKIITRVIILYDTIENDSLVVKNKLFVVLLNGHTVCFEKTSGFH